MSEPDYRELRVPTTAVEAEVLCADGRTFRGKVFIPEVASTHRGPMRPAEWINDPSPFFPFLPADETGAFLMSRKQVMVFTVSAAFIEEPDDPGEAGAVRRRVVVECGSRRIEGHVLIDMPSHQMRALDYLNRADPFLIVRDGDRHHLIRKERITRVTEPKEN